MKTHLKHLLGLALMVLIFSGCQNPSGPEIPEENEPPVVETPEDNTRWVEVEFVWGTNPQVSNVYMSDTTFYCDFHRYFSSLHQNKEKKWFFEYPKGYDRDKYLELWDNEECLKKLYEKAFEEALGNKYYKEGTIIDLTKWISEAKDLTTGDIDPCYIQLYFLAEDIGKTDYDKDNYDNYIDYLDKKSFDKIEVHNENIKVYVYWKYSM